MGVIKGLWRWRHNPLRRTTDLVEAWVALATLVLLVVGAPLAGALCGSLLDSSLQRTMQRQHQERHQVTAVVLAKSGASERSSLFDSDSSLPRDPGTRVVAQWHTPEGGAYVGTVSAPRAGLAKGATFDMWADKDGTQVKPPMPGDVANIHAGVAGVGAAVVSVGLVAGARRLIVWRLVRARHRRLDQDWAQAGPDWGRTGTGS